MTHGQKIETLYTEIEALEATLTTLYKKHEATNRRYGHFVYERHIESNSLKVKALRNEIAGHLRCGWNEEIDAPKSTPTPAFEIDFGYDEDAEDILF